MMTRNNRSKHSLKKGQEVNRMTDIYDTTPSGEPVSNLSHADKPQGSAHHATGMEDSVARPNRSGRAVILGGGRLGEWALRHIRPDDLLIATDRGALFAVQHGLRPRMSLGDFDSITPAELAEVEAGSEAVNACDPVWKDLTDAEMAFEYALSQGVQEILMLGVTGTRLDHTLANLHLLAAAEQHGVQAVIIDPHNEIRLATSRQPLTIVPSGYRYVSLLPLTWQVTGITLAGFLYPLEDAVLTLGMTRGISNELIADRGTIELKSGQLLVIQSRD
jgi:thiamine pyrophosphokinase